MSKSMFALAIILSLALMSFVPVQATCYLYEFSTSFAGASKPITNYTQNAELGYTGPFNAVVPQCLNSTYGTCNATVSFTVTLETPTITFALSVNGVYIQNPNYTGNVTGTTSSNVNTNLGSSYTRIMGQWGGYMSSVTTNTIKTNYYGLNDSAATYTPYSSSSTIVPTQVSVTVNAPSWNCAAGATNVIAIVPFLSLAYSTSNSAADKNRASYVQPYIAAQRTTTDPNNVCSNVITSYNVKMPSTCAGIKGDPQFMGLRGQSYQIHGIDGAIYNLITNVDMQLNSRFIYLNGPRPCPTMPSTGKKSVACWAHNGSYLQNLALITDGGSRLLIESGAASTGFSSVTLNGATLKPGATHQLAMKGVKQGSISFNNSWEISLQVGEFSLEIENSDEFVNVRSYNVNNWDNLAAHGLLGQTWRGKRYSGKVKEIEGDVDDYVIYSGDMFGSDFVYNQFTAY